MPRSIAAMFCRFNAQYQAGLDGDDIRLKLNRSPEPVEGRFTVRRTSTGSALWFNYMSQLNDLSLKMRRG